MAVALQRKCHFAILMSRWSNNDMNVRLKTKMSPNGRIVMPVDFRKAMGVPKGGDVFLELGQDGVRISTMKQNIERAQRLVRKYVKPGVSLADELIAERREAAKRELE